MEFMERLEKMRETYELEMEKKSLETLNVTKDSPETTPRNKHLSSESYSPRISNSPLNNNSPLFNKGLLINLTIPEEDPFNIKTQNVLLGVGHLYLKHLYYLTPFNWKINAISHAGEVIGKNNFFSFIFLLFLINYLFLNLFIINIFLFNFSFIFN